MRVNTIDVHQKYFESTLGVHQKYSERKLGVKRLKVSNSFQFVLNVIVLVILFEFQPTVQCVKPIIVCKQNENKRCTGQKHSFLH